MRLAWYRPTTPAHLADFCTDANGKQHGTSIPPPLLRPAIIAWIKTQARALVALRWRRRVALLGDAAFLARPHLVSARSRLRSSTGITAVRPRSTRREARENPRGGLHDAQYNTESNWIGSDPNNWYALRCRLEIAQSVGTGRKNRVRF